MLEVCWKEAASNKAYLCFANASNIIKEDIIVFSNILQLDSFHLPLQPPHLCQPQRFCFWVYHTLQLHSHNSIRSEHRGACPGHQQEKRSEHLVCRHAVELDAQRT